MSNLTACPLDCYDGCEIVYEDTKIKPCSSGHTKGFLCTHMYRYEEYESIKKPRYKGKEITLDEALLILKEMLKSSQKDKILYYKGSGNFALMQDVVGHFFASFGATLTNGSLCDGAGEAGIIEGRGSNKNMSLQEIEKSDVVIFWGRDPHVTSSHILPLIKDKTIIVIDPIKTKIAKMADIFVQIKPHSDIYLAMLLSRFLFVQYGVDEEYLENYASEFEDFYELTQTIRIKSVLENIDVSLGDIGNILDAVVGKKVALVCGVGIQKYRDGADVIRAIDAFGVLLGLFGKEGSGVSYLGNSKQNIPTPFNDKAKRVSKVDTEFSNYDTVFIQGANPLSQMPDSLRVKDSMSKVKNIVYFGLYENQTSQVAHLVIPAKSFLYKEDIRTSYSHNGMMFMNKIKDCEYGISEYDLARFFCDEFDIKLESEKFYVEYFKSFAYQNEDGIWQVKDREDVPYKDGFDTDDGEFVFLEEFESKSKDDENNFFLVTPKNTTSLNSQFKTKECVYLHPSLGYAQNQNIKISSTCGSVVLSVCLDSDVRKDTVLIYSGTEGVNNLTSSKHSFEGRSAIYQEEKVFLDII